MHRRFALSELKVSLGKDNGLQVQSSEKSFMIIFPAKEMVEEWCTTIKNLQKELGISEGSENDKNEEKSLAPVWEV